MGIESTTFEVIDETANEVRQGTIIDVSIRVYRKIGFENGTYSHTYFEVRFTQNEQAGPFRWDSTADEEGAGTMSDSHVIATHEAADYVEKHYGAEVDLGHLVPDQ